MKDLFPIYYSVSPVFLPLSWVEKCQIGLEQCDNLHFCLICLVVKQLFSRELLKNILSPQCSVAVLSFTSILQTSHYIYVIFNFLLTISAISTIRLSLSHTHMHTQGFQKLISATTVVCFHQYIWHKCSVLLTSSLRKWSHECLPFIKPTT